MILVRFLQFNYCTYGLAIFKFQLKSIKFSNSRIQHQEARRVIILALNAGGRERRELKAQVRVRLMDSLAYCR